VTLGFGGILSYIMFLHVCVILSSLFCLNFHIHLIVFGFRLTCLGGISQVPSHPILGHDKNTQPSRKLLPLPSSRSRHVIHDLLPNLLLYY